MRVHTVVCVFANAIAHLPTKNTRCYCCTTLLHILVLPHNVLTRALFRDTTPHILQQCGTRNQRRAPTPRLMAPTRRTTCAVTSHHAARGHQGAHGATLTTRQRARAIRAFHPNCVQSTPTACRQVSHINAKWSICDIRIPLHFTRVSSDWTCL